MSLGEDINARDSKGYTPLITCAQYGHIPCVSFMIRKGANLELEDQNGDNAMHWVINHFCLIPCQNIFFNAFLFPIFRPHTKVICLEI